jgi:hypothetical protein
MEGTDWEVNETLSDGVASYLYQQSSSNPQDWITSDEDDQYETRKKYKGDQQLYTGLSKQYILLINKAQTTVQNLQMLLGEGE